VDKVDKWFWFNVSGLECVFVVWGDSEAIGGSGGDNYSGEIFSGDNFGGLCTGWG